MKIDFNKSNLKSTINNVNDIEGLKRYKIACEEAITYCNKEKGNKNPNSNDNIQFFTEALNLCNSKIKKGIKFRNIMFLQ